MQGDKNGTDPDSVLQGQGVNEGYGQQDASRRYDERQLYGGQHSPQQKEPFYKSTWFIVLMLIFIPVVGIPLAWVFKKPDSKPGRVVLTVLSAFILVIGLASFSGGRGSSSDGSSTKETSSQQSMQQTKKEATLESISAIYSGKTTEGINLTSSNTGIKVTGVYSDGSQKTVTGWAIATPAVLVAEQTSTVTITYDNKSCDLSVACTSVTPETYKAACTPMDYDSLARDPDTYKGKQVSVTGEVIQVQEDSSGTMYRINITEGDYGIWKDTVLVASSGTGTGTRILEDDMVTVYGVSAGLFTYTSVMGASITVPSISAEYVDLN